jgi:ATP-dependent DNA helicase RecQ
MPTPQQILQQYWGFSSFRGKQLAIIEAVLAKQDALALLPTGGGKSICFQVPTLLMQGMCLVISPLIALMKDQVKNLEKKNIPAAALYSGMSYYGVKTTLEAAANNAYKFLYLSPERLESNLFLDYLPQLDVCLVAVDEAHCISQWGYNFRPPYLRIAQIKKQLPHTPFLALTASATPAVQKDIIAKLHLQQENVFLQSFEKPNLSYSVFKCDSKINKAIEVLQKVKGSSIVYCNTRKQTKETALLLQQHGFSVDYYHAGLTQAERNEKQEHWLNNTIRIMVCTNAFGMGIDKPDVTTVIHLNLPDCLENYYQEAGRAGRNGTKAYAVLLYNESDINNLTQLPEIRYPNFNMVRDVYQYLADYLQIPVGIGEGNYYAFNLQEFCNNFNVEATVVIPVLKVLEQQGYISFNENIFIPSTVEFTADKNTVNEVEQTHAHLDAVMKCLLRTYQGIFENKVSINEKLIAKLLRIPIEQVIAQLKILHGYGIINYIPAKETPQIYFATNRAPAKYLNLDATHHLTRKEIFTDSINHFINYIQNTHSCRSQIISAHFGDSAVNPCGICDNCLDARRKAITNAEFEAIKNIILQQLNLQPCSKQILFDACKSYTKKNTATVIDFLLQEGVLTVNSHAMLITKVLP